jgi:6,7-dimethyl-8-ribityllumazine synthase
VRFAIVRPLFNDEITAGLLEGALQAFDDARVTKRNVDIYEVPGAFELPLTALWLAESRRYAAIICLGCVIRGETAHFDYVAGEAARGIADVALKTKIPVIFGVLTTENVAQARARSARVGRGQANHTGSQAHSNKGYEATNSALQMAALSRKLRKK